MNKFIFDVDGTLTPSSGRIDKDFAVWFSHFCEDNQVYLVTGSDRDKTVEQVGEYIYHKCERVYQCNGNDVWICDENIRTNQWTLPESPHNYLAERLTASDFSKRTGLHFEHRPGMVNFSVVGRNATLEERARYIAYDTFENERNTIANAFNRMFPDLQATVGGETGIDIAPKGSDKSQILVDFNQNDTLWFFGDAMHEGGNDYPLAEVVDIKRHVTDWRMTKEYLQVLQEQRIAS